MQSFALGVVLLALRLILIFLFFPISLVFWAYLFTSHTMIFKLSRIIKPGASKNKLFNTCQ